jgi:hypothetical protein
LGFTHYPRSTFTDTPSHHPALHLIPPGRRSPSNPKPIPPPPAPHPALLFLGVPAATLSPPPPPRPPPPPPPLLRPTTRVRIRPRGAWSGGRHRRPIPAGHGPWRCGSGRAASRAPYRPHCLSPPPPTAPGHARAPRCFSTHLSPLLGEQQALLSHEIWHGPPVGVLRSCSPVVAPGAAERWSNGFRGPACQWCRRGGEGQRCSVSPSFTRPRRSSRRRAAWPGPPSPRVLLDSIRCVRR